MNILALETSGTHSQVALLHDGALFQRTEQKPSHSRILLNMIEEVLEQAGLDLQRLECVAVCVGPGSFTGLRIGIAVAQGLAFAAQLPIVPVSSLAVLALDFYTDHKEERDAGAMVLATIDARKSEVYCGWYYSDNGSIRLVGEQQVVPPSELPRPPALSLLNNHNTTLSELAVDNIAMYIVGSGLLHRAQMPVWPSTLLSVDGCYAVPSVVGVVGLAEHQFMRGETVKSTELRPIYVRDKVTD